MLNKKNTNAMGAITKKKIINLLFIVLLVAIVVMFAGCGKSKLELVTVHYPTSVYCNTFRFDDSGGLKKIERAILYDKEEPGYPLCYVCDGYCDIPTTADTLQENMKAVSGGSEGEEGPPLEDTQYKELEGFFCVQYETIGSTTTECPVLILFKKDSTEFLYVSRKEFDWDDLTIDTINDAIKQFSHKNDIGFFE